MASSATISFMSLPRELRDVIYHELWYHTVISITSPQGIFRLYYDTKPPLQYTGLPGNVIEGLPQWLLCNTFMLHEGIQQLKSRAKWAALLHANSSIRSPLIGLPVATNLMVKGFLHRDPTVSDYFNLVSKRTLSTAVPFPVLLGQNLRNLCLSLFTVCFTGHNGRVNPDFAYNMDLPQFNNVQINLDSFYIRLVAPVRVESNALMRALQVACEREARRIGGFTVGGNADVSSHADFCRGDPRSGSLPWRLEVSVRCCKPHTR